MLSAIGRRATDWVKEPVHTNVYGLGRSLLAASSALTLLATPAAKMFLSATATYAPRKGFASIGIFALLSGHLEIARGIAIALLLLVASGWRPRWTGILHFWIALSIHTNADVVDGGDQLASNLALLLIPVTLTDSRRWHWLPPSRTSPIATLVAKVFVVMVRIQVCGVYFDATFGKLPVAEWADGTVLYYWFTDPVFGAPLWLQAAIHPLLVTEACLVMTWGVLLVEFLLSAAIIADQRWRNRLLVVGICFHFGIAVVHGLISFAMVMCAALLLYLRPWDAKLAWSSSAARSLFVFVIRPGPSKEPSHVALD